MSASVENQVKQGRDEPNSLDNSSNNSNNNSNNLSYSSTSTSTSTSSSQLRPLQLAEKAGLRARSIQTGNLEPNLNLNPHLTLTPASPVLGLPDQSSNHLSHHPMLSTHHAQSKPANNSPLNLFRRKSNKTKANPTSTRDPQPSTSTSTSPPPPLPTVASSNPNHSASSSHSHPIHSPSHSTLTPAPIHNSLVPSQDLVRSAPGDLSIASKSKTGADSKSKGFKGKSKGKAKMEQPDPDGKVANGQPVDSERSRVEREMETSDKTAETALETPQKLKLESKQAQDRKNDDNPIQSYHQDSIKLHGKEKSSKTASSASSSSTTSNLQPNLAAPNPNSNSNSDSNPQPNSAITSSPSAAQSPQRQSSSSSLAPPPPLGLDSNLNSSESWLNPQDSEGQFIRKTYQHFDLKGVKDDGFVEGTEFTRVKSSKAAWEVEDEEKEPEDQDGDKTYRDDRQEKWGNQDSFLSAENKEEVLKTPTSPFGFLLSRNRTNSSRPSTPMGPPVSSEDFRKALEKSEEDDDRLGKRSKSRDGASSGSSIFRSKSAKGKGKQKESESKGGKIKGNQKADEKSQNQAQKETSLEIDSVLANGITRRDQNQVATSNTSPTPTSTSSFDQSADRHHDHASPANQTSINPEVISQHQAVEQPSPEANSERERDPERKNGVRSQNSFLLPTNGPKSTNSHSSGLSNLSEVSLTLQDRINHKEEAEKKRQEFLGKVDRYGFFSRRLDESLHGRVAILPSSAYSIIPSSKSSKLELQYPSTLQTGEPTLLNSPSLSMQSQASSDINSPYLNGSGRFTSNGGSSHGKETSSNAETIVASVSEIRRKNEVAMKEREVERVKKWNRMLVVKSRDEGLNVLKYGFTHLKSNSSTLEGVKGSSSSAEEKLRRRIYKGIPDPWRSAAWGALIERLSHLGDLEELSEIQKGEKSSSKSRDPNEMLNRIKKKRRDEVSRYRRLVERPSPHDVQIDLDVPRTISGHISFHTRYGKGQRSLFHLLHCFSLFCKDCGYCQGMGPIAATLLCYLTEEVAYDFLCSLHGRVPSNPLPSSPLFNPNDPIQSPVATDSLTSTSKGGIGLHETFQPGFPGVVENFFVQESLVSIYLPHLSAKFKTEGVSTSAYATRWYITLFANSVPFETQLRLWDVLLFEGKDFLVIFSLAILWGLRDRLMRKDFSFEKCLETLSSFLVPENDDAMLNWCKELLGKNEIRKQIRKIRKEWKELVVSGEAMSRLT